MFPHCHWLFLIVFWGLQIAASITIKSDLTGEDLISFR
jgi:hypothetical protein